MYYGKRSKDRSRQRSGDLDVTRVVSRNSTDRDKVTEWDFDGFGVDFVDGYYFESGPALRKGDPTKFPMFNAVLPGLRE